MAADCTHIPQDLSVPDIHANGCEDCLASGHRNWVHLRFCQTCGRVGCCDSSPETHATKHNHDTGHPMTRSFEPAEEWWWCYPDSMSFFIDGAPHSPSHDGTR